MIKCNGCRYEDICNLSDENREKCKVADDECQQWPREIFGMTFAQIQQKQQRGDK